MFYYLHYISIFSLHFIYFVNIFIDYFLEDEGIFYQLGWVILIFVI